jgi:ABC-type nickel/cobalt efflux system permease component RcnA
MISARTKTRLLAASLALAAGILILAGVADPTQAQGGLFGAGAGSPPPGVGGITGWILGQEAAFYRAFSGAIRGVSESNAALFGLFGLSLLYGVFHAAGPGHGKAVISSYLIANDETWRRGVVLSFASAPLQSLAAVTIVTVAAVALNATAKAMGDTIKLVETASYALIVGIGLRLAWLKGRAFLGALQAGVARPALAPVGAAVTLTSLEHQHGDHDHHHHDHGAHAGAGCGHSHGPQPQDIAGPGGWRRGLSAIVAVGLRPCSGAILVLVFAFAQEVYWAGVAATFLMGLGTALTVAAIATLAVAAKGLAARLAHRESRGGVLALRGLEFAGAGVIVLFGAFLLMGYMATERMFGV